MKLCSSYNCSPFITRDRNNFLECFCFISKKKGKCFLMRQVLSRKDPRAYMAVYCPLDYVFITPWLPCFAANNSFNWLKCFRYPFLINSSWTYSTTQKNLFNLNHLITVPKVNYPNILWSINLTKFITPISPVTRPWHSYHLFGVTIVMTLSFSSCPTLVISATHMAA